MNRRDFLDWLYEYCEKGQVETRALPETKQAFHDRGNWASVDKFCKAHFNQNLYFAVATRDGGGTKEHIKEIPAVWADIDFKDYSDKDAAQKAVYEFPLRPSVMLESGGGYQALWRFKEPAVKDEIPDIEKILKGIAHHLGADNSATDASRILRLPDTINHKYEHKPQVKVVWDNHTLEYNLEDFEEHPLLLEVIDSKGLGLTDPAKNREKASCERYTALQNVTKRDILHPLNFTVGHHDETLFSLAWHLAKSGMPESEVLKAIEYIAKTLDPDNETAKWAREKTRSAFNRLSQENRNLSYEIEEWVSVTSGYFSVTECYKDLDIVTQRYKNNCRQIFYRLVKKGILERHPSKNGVYRRIEKDCDEIDFLNAPTDEIDIKLPLGLSDHSKTYRKNIIVFAGEQDSGKTALLLNTVKDNMDKYDIRYFSSEMAETELRSRLELFPNTGLEEWKFKPYERSSNFADVIRPNAINIIDYLEIDDAFYNVAGILKGIHDKLKEGIAIVALQKDPLKDVGRGGSFSLEKPRLYVTISNDYPGHTVRIKKCKNWRTSNNNPNGLLKHFKLAGGCKIVEETSWYLEGDEEKE